MNLFTNLRSEFGQDFVKTVRKWDKFERKIARHKNHLVFSLRCKDEGIIPSSLRIRSPINTSNARNIIEKARKGLLQERIRVTTNKLNTFESESKKCRESVVLTLPSDRLSQVRYFVTRSRETVFFENESKTH